MHKSLRVAAAVLLCIPALGFPQQNSTPTGTPARPAATPWSATEEGPIKVDVEVTDRPGKPVLGLTKQDFTILEDGHPRSILSFHSFNTSSDLTDPPPEVILVIDAVNQSSDVLSYAEQETGKFLRQNGGDLADPVSLAFVSNGGLETETEPSTDGNASAAWLDRLKANTIPSGAPETAEELQRRFELSTLQTISIAERAAQRPGRKLLIWIGRGWVIPDQANRRNRKDDQQAYFKEIVELATRLREARISVYNISRPADPSGPASPRADFDEASSEGVKSVGQAEARDLSLGALASASGGEVRKPDNDLAGLITACIEHANSFYTLSFDPPASDHVDEYHAMHVLVARQNTVTRTRTGYYDEPTLAVRFVTVGQLEHIAELAQEVSDAEAARQLSRPVLNERLSSPMLSNLKATLRGRKAQQALVALGDASSFLPLPVAEIPANASPNADEQRVIISRTVDYLHNTIPKLPNLFAARTTAHHEQAPQKTGQGGTPSSPAWRLASTSDEVVLYRDRKEVLETRSGKTRNLSSGKRNFVVTGVFGPILSMAVNDAGPDKLTWSHWEQGETGPLAAFQFAVPKSRSHFETSYHSLFAEDADQVISERIGYHGEIAIDPENGTIFRLAVMADPDPSTRIVRSDVMVEYGPVEIAGRTYICPVRSVAISREQTWAIDSTFLNDVSFSNYHVFRPTARILTGDISLPHDK